MPLPADMPATRTMQSLGWLIHGDDVVDEDDTLLVQMPAGGVWCILNHELQILSDRGWVDLTVDEHCTVTERGVYWYNRWFKEQAK